MNTALVLINSASRSGERQRDEALRLLAAEGVSLIVAPPTPAEDIPALIERHRKEIDRVIVGGGDGSLQAVAPALAWQSLRLGILPLGTANDLARTLDIPTRLEDACRLLASDSERRIDLGEVNGHYFFNVANIGLGVEVRRQLNDQLKHRWGRFGYPFAALRALRRQRPFRALICTGDQEFSLPAIQIAVGNGRYYGGGLLIDEDARIDDGQLDLYALRADGLLPLLANAPALRSGKLHRLRGGISATAPECRVSTPEPLPVTADGEIIGSTPAQFRVAARALRVIARTGKE